MSNTRIEIPGCNCEKCGCIWEAEEIRPARELLTRADYEPGVLPAGECPDCGSLTYWNDVAPSSKTQTRIAPLTHMGGDRKDTLLDNMRAAVEPLNHAIEALMAASPHGRNYYPMSEPGAFQRAVEEHTARIDKLLAVRGELLALWNAIEAGKTETDPPDPR